MARIHGAKGLDMTADIDVFINEQMAEQHLPGLSLLVARRGETLFAQSYGLANLELNVPVHNDSVYEIGSVTKPFTASTVLLLAADTLLDLDTPIITYLPNVPTPATWTDITVRHPLTHTAGIVRDGIPDYWSTPAAMCQEYRREQMLELIATAPLEFHPGTQHCYSNNG